MSRQGDTLFETEEDVGAYVEATTGLDARREISELRRLIGDGARVLELGSGGGIDLAHLARHFDVVGSDPSAAARSWIANHHPGSASAPAVIDLRAEDLSRLRDALEDSSTVETQWADRIDAIFSSKVLHLLAEHELLRCIAAQARLLAPDGVAMHLVWAPPNHSGDQPSEDGRHGANELARLWRGHFQVVEVTPRSELGHHDLLRVTARGSRSPGGVRRTESRTELS